MLLTTENPRRQTEPTQIEYIQLNQLGQRQRKITELLINYLE